MRAARLGMVRDACALRALEAGFTAAATVIYWTPGPLLLARARKVRRRKFDGRQVAADKLLGDLAAHKPSKAVRDALAGEAKR